MSKAVFLASYYNDPMFGAFKESEDYAFLLFADHSAFVVTVVAARRVAQLLGVPAGRLQTRMFYDFSVPDTPLVRALREHPAEIMRNGESLYLMHTTVGLRLFRSIPVDSVKGVS